MIRQAFWIAMLALPSMFALLVSRASICAAEKDEKRAAKPAAFTHIVLFRLTKDAPEGEVEALINDCHNMLGKISSVRELKVGKPAENGTKVAKKDYQVGLLVLFDDADGLKRYLDDKLHVEFLKKHGKYLDEKLEVFDFQNQVTK